MREFKKMETIIKNAPAITDEDVEAIRSMAVDGDENAESLLDLFEECKSRMDFEI